ncbi:MAG TPA: OmpP1/FadL family transporter [Pseudolabrys sp.]|nr:OmpP1/FadL family transporter [Pseudolabrys sp.]
MNLKLTIVRVCGGTLFLSSLALASPAHAGAFQVRTQSAEGFGTAIAGVAAGSALSFSYWNPAALSNIDGIQIEGVANGVFPSIHLDPGAGGSVGIGKNALVPASYIALPVNDRMTFGLSITSPFGLATKTPTNWAGQVYGRDSEIFSVNVNPMLSYRINDMVSVGAGVQVQYFKAKLSQATGIFPDAPSATLKADGLGVGFNLGVQLKPWAGGTVGIGYRSAISEDLGGDLSMFGMSMPAKATLKTPQLVSFGVRQEMTDRFRLMGTVEWTNWSSINIVPIYGVGTGAQLTTLPLRYRDGWLFSVGGEFDIDKQLTARAGIGYEIAPVNDLSRDVRLPEPNQLILSAGLSYRYTERMTFDLAVTQSLGLGSGPVTIGPGDPRYLGLPFSATSDLNVTIVSAGLKIKLDGVSLASR